MFWCSLAGADRPPKEAMPVAITCFYSRKIWVLESFAGSGKRFVRRK